MELFKLLEDIVNKSPGDTGNYVCDCGYFYSIGPCGFPNEQYKKQCPLCKQDIGYGQGIIKNNSGYYNHGLAIRPGHYRIFKNAEQKREQMSRFGVTDENIPNRTLEQYKEEVIKPLIYSCDKGITLIDKEDFLDKKKTVRNLSTISYRLLNFILYNHLFFANCLGYISEENLKEHCLIKNMNCLEMIQINWNLLEEVLKDVNIFSIQAFINLIFNDLSELISGLKIINRVEDLIEFEEKVEKKVNDNIEKYPDYYQEYLTMSNEYSLLNEKNIKVILNETLPPTIYSEKEYPLFKYFIYTEYHPNFEEALKQQELYKNRYPLLTNYINLTEKQKKIKYLSKFNEFTNSMVETYSYKITREDAKKKELSKTNEYDVNKFKIFKNIWDNIKQYAIKYKFSNEMPIKELNSNDNLIYFLNDCNELGNGMYLAAACQNFISWQNDFLESIIESADFYGSLHFYVENMKIKIPVQEANPNQILSFDDCFKNSDYKDFNDLIYTYTRRDIYDKDKINYQKYNQFIFDFSGIEEELAKLILPEKCLFESADKLNFMIFWGEGFRGGQSEIVKKFYSKYPQEDLNETQKQKISKDIQKLYNDKEYDFKEFFGSMQLLIFFLVNNNFSPDKDLSIVVNEKPDYLKLGDKCNNFFLTNEFKINQFMSIFFYVEHLSFQELIKTLQPKYKMPIDETVIQEIRKKLENKKEDEELPWKEVAAATRRYISRYLVGEMQTKDKKEIEEFVFKLPNIDLWEEKYGKLKDLEYLVTSKIKEFKLTVGQAFNFYEIIGEDDKNSIILIESNEDINKEQQNNNQSAEPDNPDNPYPTDDSDDENLE